MDKKDPTNDYTNGQMMGMLCIIRLLKSGQPIAGTLLDKIERTATESLATYLEKPEEDIILLVDKQLELL